MEVTEKGQRVKVCTTRISQDLRLAMEEERLALRRRGQKVSIAQVIGEALTLWVETQRQRRTP